MAENEGPGAPGRERPRAIRLTIAYDGDRMELVSRQSVAMRVPPSDPVGGMAETAETAEMAGFWVDLKDAEDRTLFRRVMHEPIRRDVEVFSPDPRQTIQRAPMPEGAEPRGVFSVVLPEMEAAEAVSLIGPPLGPAVRELGVERAEPSREIARFALKPRT